MKRTLLTLALSLIVTLPTFAAEPAKPADQAKPAEEKGASSLITNALRGLSALLPKPEAPVNDSGAVSTIGIRGAESTATLVNPYWKDDRSNDPAFVAEVSAYTAAHNLLNEKRWEEAQQAMSRFLTDHPKSDLVPNAQFGQAIANAGANRPKEAAEQFRKFASAYPNHPLRSEAEKLATAMASSR